MSGANEEQKGEGSKKSSNNDSVKLISNDGQEFVVPVRVLCQSPTLAKMLDGRFKESSKIIKASDN